jgi:iron complex outermembrane recepter protein
MTTLSTLQRGASLLALVIGAAASTGAAQAQSGSNAATNSEEVVVTGTSFRGVAPVGSNLITVGAEDIKKMSANTVTEMMANMPSIEGMGNSGRANASSSNGGPGVAVYIHQLGANGSNSTLVLIDGHRVPHSGVTNYFVNPNNVPAPMIERIEVLAEGASAVYGSDAVAGVINFITRKKFDGFQLSGSYTKIDGSDGYSMSALGGHSWESGSWVASASYTIENELPNTARPWTNPLLQTARAAEAGLTGPGSTNFGNFNCDPATVRANGAGNIYLNPTSATNVANAAANSVCSNWEYGSIFARDVRLNTMLRVNQEIGEKMTFNGDLIYGQRKSAQKASRGTLTATAFGNAPGNVQSNPFYINPPGVTATRQEVRYNFDQLLGPGAESQGGDSFLSGHADLTYRLFGDWEANFLVSSGRDDAYAAENLNAVDTGQALLALNGTTQTGGSMVATAIPGYNAIILNTPLTTANALDVWNPAATNRTSAAVRAGLIDPTNINHGVYSLTQFRAGMQGSVLQLPAGPLQVAFGLEMLNTQIYQYGTRPLNVTNAAVASRLFQFHFNREDLAQYVETQIPVVSPEMGIPLMQKLDVNVAVRHDDYSDFGATTNPKGSFTWQIIDGLKVRGNASTSFVAPPLNLVGGKAGLANFSNVGGSTQNASIPVAFYPLVTQMGIAGCTAASVTCNISTLQGISSSVGDASAIAQKGKGWAIGADWDPSFIPGLSLQATYWDTQLIGGMTAPQVGARVTTASLANALTLFPACATAADITAFASQAPQNSVFPACVQFTYRSDTSNYLTYYAAGVDFNIAYRIETDFGTLRADYTLSELTKFDEGFAYKMAPTPDQTFSALDTNGFASAFPSISTNMRGHLGWGIGNFVADVYFNYTGPYKNVNANAMTPPASNAAGVYAGVGGDPVDSNLTWDLHFGYDITEFGALSDTQISLAIKNVGDKLPPYWNAASGYDNLVANPIGREMKVTLSKRF